MSRHQYRRGKTPFRRGGSDSTPSPRAHREYCALRGVRTMPRCRGNMGDAVRARSLGEHACRRQLRGVLGRDFAMRGARTAILLTGLCRAIIRHVGHSRAIIRHVGHSRAIIRHIPCPRWRTIAQERWMCPNIARQSPAWGNPARKRQVRSEYPQSIFGAHALPY